MFSEDCRFATFWIGLSTSVSLRHLCLDNTHSFFKGFLGSPLIFAIDCLMKFSNLKFSYADALAGTNFSTERFAEDAVDASHLLPLGQPHSSTPSCPRRRTVKPV